LADAVRVSVFYSGRQFAPVMKHLVLVFAAADDRTPGAGLVLSPQNRGKRRARSEESPPSYAALHFSNLLARLGGRDHVMGIEHEFFGRSLVEVPVAVGSVIERDDGNIYRLGNLDLVVQDRLHKLAMILHHRTLARREGVRFGPAQADPHA